MDRLVIASLTSLTHNRSLGASPRAAVAAVRRKLETETPGTSTGYCIARNRPARARSSTRHREHVGAVEGDRAAGDGVLRVPGEGVGEGRLAGAVGPHDRVGLPRPDGQVDAAQDLAGVAVGVDGDVQVADLEGGHVRCSKRVGSVVRSVGGDVGGTSTRTSSPSMVTG